MFALLESVFNPILNPTACLPPAAPERLPEEPVETLIKRLEKRLRQQLKHSPSGNRDSVLKGQGMTFCELRQYVPGDDIRKLDWNVFARTLTPHIREYQAEKQQTIWLAIDASPSMRFGQNRSKFDAALEIAAIWGLLAQRTQSRLGAILANGEAWQLLPLRHHPQQLAHLLKQARQFGGLKLGGAQWPVPDALPQLVQHLSPLVSKSHTVIVFSDFITTSGWPMLRQLAQKTQLLSYCLVDPVEQSLPTGLGLLPVQDCETGKSWFIDTSQPRQLQQIQQAVQAIQDQHLRQLQQMGKATLASTQADPLQVVLGTLQQTGLRAS